MMTNGGGSHGWARFKRSNMDGNIEVNMIKISIKCHEEERKNLRKWIF